MVFFVCCEFRCNSFRQNNSSNCKLQLCSTNMFQNNSSKLTVILILITLSMLTWLLFSNKQFTNSLPLIQLNPKENLTEKERCDTYYKTKEPRVLCTVFTTRASHSTRMKAIHDTWSKRSFLLLLLVFSL